MINKFHFYHWVVLSKIIHMWDRIKNLHIYPTKSNSSYVINDNIGIYIKYSEKRMSPWRYSFLKEHQDEILDMKNNLKDVFIVFVCNDDWVVCLSFNELKNILDHNHEEIEWVAISRKKREKYVVTWTDWKLWYRIGDIDFPKKIFTKSNSKLINFLWF